MFTLKHLTVLALAGTTMAAPAIVERDWSYGRGYWNGGWNRGGSNVVTETAYATATATATAYYDPDFVAAPTPTPTPEAEAPAATPEVVAAAPVVTTTAAAAAAPASSATGYMAIVDQYRSAGGLSALTQSSQLEANALKTANDGNGQMVHELNSGSMAQVLAPGNANDFLSVYVGGWLCEKPSLPGLNGICSTETAGWDHSSGETGHADILTSTSYSKIGCALAKGIWACDLA